MGVDIDALVMAERISPMEHRNMALAHARQTVAQADRREQHHILKAAKEAVMLQDLAVTRKTAEDRAESLWRIENAIPLTATMDSLNRGGGATRPFSAGDRVEEGYGVELGGAEDGFGDSQPLNGDGLQ